MHLTVFNTNEIDMGECEHLHIIFIQDFWVAAF